MTHVIDLATATPRIIEAVLFSHTANGYEYDSWHMWSNENPKAGSEVAGLGTVYTVDTEGGGEGSGEHMHAVIKVVQGDVVRYFKKTGYYSSYGGSDWDGEFLPVNPVTKTVTVYE